MHKEVINGVEVKTNFREKVCYPMATGNEDNIQRVPFGCSEEDFLKDAVLKGYKTVTFYEMATRVRGYHHVYARCR